MSACIEHQVTQLLHTIRNTALACHRMPDTIQLMAVSKGQSIEAIKAAFEAGCFHFGENRVQEALAKKQALKTYPIRWHFIGGIQSNKTKAIAEHFDWVHSVSQERIALRLNAARPLNLSPLKICVEVNLDAQVSKSGISPCALIPLLEKVIPLKNLDLQGLMAIPLHHKEEEKQYQSFLRLQTLLHQANEQLGLNMQVLSMGMSADYKAAIRAGSTFLRLGKALFNP